MAQTIDDFFQAQQEAENLLKRFYLAKENFTKTGDWMGADFGISLNPATLDPQSPSYGLPPGNWPKSRIEADEVMPRYATDDALKEYEELLKKRVSTAGFRSERKKMRIAQNTTDVEDLTDDEFVSLAKRNQELLKLKDSDPIAFNKIFNPDVTIPGTNEKLMYAIHSGAPELQSGMLDPSFSIGTKSQYSNAGGDTKGANRGKAKEFRERTFAKDANDKPVYSEETKIIRQRQLDIITDTETQQRRLAGEMIESANFMSASPPGAGAAIGYFGRTEWNGLATKGVMETAELASDLNSTTGGRGSMYLIRGVKNYTINVTGLNADAGETPILGKHKPIGGLSSTVSDIEQGTGGRAGLMHGEVVSDKNIKRIDLAWLEKQINEDVAKITSGKVPLEEIFGPAAEHAGIKTAGLTTSVPFVPPKALKESMEKAEKTVAARVASNAVPQTIEESVSVAVRRSGATGKLLNAASQASSAVAAGTSNSAALRGAGAALSILRGVI